MTPSKKHLEHLWVDSTATSLAIALCEPWRLLVVLRVAVALNLDLVVGHNVARGECRLRVDSVETELGVGSNVVVRELAEVGIVDTDNFGLFRRTQSQSRDEVHDPAEDSRHDEGVGTCGDGVGDLVAELNPVVVEPSTWDLGDTVEARDGCLGEETGHDAADDTSNGVGRKDIERLVDSDEELDLGGKVTADTSDETDRDGSGSSDVTRGGGDTDKTGDGTGAKTDGGELALEPPVEQHPSDTADGGGEVGHDASLDGTKVGGESGSTVEAEPAEPEEDCAEDDKGSVVGLVSETLGAVAASLAEVHGDGEGGSTGRDVDGRSTGEVKTAHDERPSVRVPGPACDRTVDNSQPAEKEDHDGTDLGSLGETTDGEDTSDELSSVVFSDMLSSVTYSEHALVDTEEEFGNSRRSDGWGAEDSLEAEVLQVADESGSGF